MNISYEKSKLLKDNIHALNKNRFPTNMYKIYYTYKSAHPPTNGIRAQQFKQYGRDVYIRVRVIELELDLKLKNYLRKY